ncbi:MAG: hypothetical protein HWE20_09365 [Gammaproteobacteria bacterium]|nr:hypothetical protein [Gammaproteobacteria bacterium]
MSKIDASLSTQAFEEKFLAEYDAFYTRAEQVMNKVELPTAVNRVTAESLERAAVSTDVSELILEALSMTDSVETTVSIEYSGDGENSSAATTTSKVVSTLVLVR